MKIEPRFNIGQPVRLKIDADPYRGTDWFIDNIQVEVRARDEENLSDLEIDVFHILIGVKERGRHKEVYKYGVGEEEIEPVVTTSPGNDDFVLEPYDEEGDLDPVWGCGRARVHHVFGRKYEAVARCQHGNFHELGQGSFDHCLRLAWATRNGADCTYCAI